MPTLPVADVIFPAFYAPYLWQIFDPIAAIAALTTEFVFYKWWSKATQPARLIIVVLVANVASSVAGVIIATMLPTGYEPRFVAGGSGPWAGQTWNHFAKAAWFAAFLISIAVEWPVVVAFRRFLYIRRAFVAVVCANVLSYAILLVVLFISLRLSLV